jgi:hypothetical protein
VIFDAEDFHCSPAHEIDDDRTVRAIVDYLTLRPGDTDREYFARYTPRQWAFVRDEAEDLHIFGLDDGPELLGA